MKVRAAVLEEFGRPLVVQEVDLAEPRAGEVLVRLVACGVCHTDLYTASGADPSGYAPCVLGHEGAGVVEAVGEGVSSVAPGDHVVTLFSPQCGECEHCRSPKTTQVEPGSTFARSIAAPSPVVRPHANRQAASSGASGETLASAISGITVASAKVEQPMKWRSGSPPRARRVVPSGR